MSEQKPIDTAPTDGTQILAWFPDLECWEVVEAHVVEAYGMQIVEWVDQWNNEPLELAGRVGPCQPTTYVDLPEPPQ